MDKKTLIELYDRIIKREYKILQLEKKKAPPIIIRTHQEMLQKYEEQVAAHPLKPNSIQEEANMKINCISVTMEYLKERSGLCDDCTNYLPNRIIDEEHNSDRAKERIRAIKLDDIVCTKTTPGLRDEEPKPIICPFYHQDEFLAGGLGYQDLAIWENLKKKYESLLPESREEPKKRF